MKNKFSRRILPFSIATIAMCIWVQAYAFAAFYKKDGVDEATGRAYRSLSILSIDKKAKLSFICDEGASYPRITFKRRDKIANKGEPFKLRYLNDNGLKDKHNFLALEDENIGRFFIRHTQLYAARFGAQPLMFKEGTASFSAEYLNWDAHIRQTVLHDMVDGHSVSITIWDELSAPDNYHFKTTGFTKFLPLIASCLKDPTE